MPTFCAMPSKDETVPRWNLGTWSEIVAMNGARVAFAPSWARHQPTVTTATLVPVAITTKAIVITTVPATIQGRRRPQRAVVRSDRRPNSTLPITANSAPNPATVASAGAFSASGTIDWTFTPIPMIAGPSSATKNTNCATTNAVTNLGPTSFVGSLNQWCSCGFNTSSATAASGVGGRSLYGLPGVLLIRPPPSQDRCSRARQRGGVVNRDQPSTGGDIEPQDSTLPVTVAPLFGWRRARSAQKTVAGRNIPCSAVRKPPRASIADPDRLGHAAPPSISTPSAYPPPGTATHCARRAAVERVGRRRRSRPPS